MRLIKQIIVKNSCQTCPGHSEERNGTLSIVRAGRYDCSDRVQGERGQSQFSPLNLHSLV